MKRKKITCANPKCRKIFLTNNGDRKYCRNCQSKFKICLECEKEFFTEFKYKIFCSNICIEESRKKMQAYKPVEQVKS